MESSICFIFTVVKRVARKAVDELMELVAAGSVVTDDFRSYMHLGGEGWDHRVVNHSLGRVRQGRRPRQHRGGPVP